VSLSPKKIFAIALCCAGLYAAVLGGMAIAQDPAATSTATPEATQTPAEQAFTPTRHLATPTPTRPDADPDATATQTATPTVSSTPFSTPATATPYPSPVRDRRRQRPRPGATATPGSLGLDLRASKHKRRNGRSGNGAIVDQGCLDGTPQEVDEAARRARRLGRDSTSTTASECDLLNSKAPDDVLGGDTPRATERPDGTPTPANPGYSLATPGAAPIGVPNFFIDKFRIPPFLLPVYQAAGIEYGVRWEVLAAINEIETDYGRNLNVSSAGALGWMQFMPATWQQYGVDANRDGLKDPFNPVDAIFAAARYLRAAGAETDVRRAIFAYNHADWYVDSVLMRARLIGGLPSNFVGSLTGLTQGRFPVHAKATYAGQVQSAQGKTKAGANAALVVESDSSAAGSGSSPAAAPRSSPSTTADRAQGRDRAARQVHPAAGLLRQHLHVRHLARSARPTRRPSRARRPRRRSPRSSSCRRRRQADRAPPRHRPQATRPTRERSRRPKPRAVTPADAVLPAAAPAKQRLFAHPSRPNALAAGGAAQLGDTFSPPTRPRSASTPATSSRSR
jgi:hypothetical protein